MIILCGLGQEEMRQLAARNHRLWMKCHSDNFDRTGSTRQATTVRRILFTSSLALCYAAVLTLEHVQAQDSVCSVWPREDYTNTCQLRRCGKKYGKLANVWDPPHSNCSKGEKLHRTRHIYTTNMIDNCTDAPGKPQQLTVSLPIAFGGGFAFHVQWNDPPNAEHLAGYRITQLHQGWNYGNDISLRSMRESGLPKGENRVVFTTDKGSISEAGIKITPGYLKSRRDCFVPDKETSHIVLRVVTLPIENYSLQHARADLIMPNCETLNCPRVSLADDNFDCQTDLQNEEDVDQHDKIVPVCLSPACLPHYVTVTGMQISNRSATFALSWAPQLGGNSSFRLKATFGYLNAGGQCTNCSRSMETSDKGIMGEATTYTIPDIGDEDFECASVSFRSEVCGLEDHVGSYSLTRDDLVTALPSSTPTAITYQGVVTSVSALPPTESATSSHITPDHPKGSASNLTLYVAMGGLAVILLILMAIVFMARACHSDCKSPCTFASRYQKDKFHIKTSSKMHVHRELRRTGCSVYLTYSRFTNASRQRAHQLAAALRRFEVHVVFDGDPWHAVKMADNREAWMDEWMQHTDYAIVLLDETYPMSLDMTQAMFQAQLNADVDDSFKLTWAEVTRIQALEFSGRSHRIIPVVIGSVSSVSPPIPVSMRMKTVYRLPKDFTQDATCPQLERLIHYLHNAGKIQWSAVPPRFSESSV
eukprot:scpid43601/ scgid18009/ 